MFLIYRSCQGLFSGEFVKNSPTLRRRKNKCIKICRFAKIYFMWSHRVESCKRSLFRNKNDLLILLTEVFVHLYISHLLGSNLGCGFIPGCEKCNDGLICKKCRTVFIPVEYERSKNTIIRCIRSCPMGYNITSRKGYPKICVRTELGRFLWHLILRLERYIPETRTTWEVRLWATKSHLERPRTSKEYNPGIYERAGFRKH